MFEEKAKHLSRATIRYGYPARTYGTYFLLTYLDTSTVFKSKGQPKYSRQTPALTNFSKKMPRFLRFLFKYFRVDPT
jgi:hypothetical protein